MRKSKREHKHLYNLENIVVHKETCPPYSDYVLDLVNPEVIPIPNLVKPEVLLLQEIADAKVNRRTTIRVSIVSENMEGNPMDDIQGLRHLIFEVILADGFDFPLPVEWEEFRNLFSAKPLNYPLIACHYCMWDVDMRLQFMPTLYEWLHTRSARIQAILGYSIRNIGILQTNYWEKMDGDKTLESIFHGSGKKTYCRSDVGLNSLSRLIFKMYGSRFVYYSSIFIVLWPFI
ncbi:hypothetical protein POM88_050740 [Heracleum sosnowskyi]|uniref:Uncharacterized protein n=1 Tax=Heracleum sosnowskyi TaxID=360622 RepID=A0AAD8M2R2_9APIA|nr:hypothetical protein POM88_050740 [Heracleum sosnowskyi]